MAEYNLYTHEEVKRAREEGYQDGKRASKWSTWDWGTFYVAMVVVVVVLAFAGTIGYFKYENRDKPTFNWTAVNGQPCVLMKNPDYTSTDMFPQDEIWTLCLEGQ